MARVFMKGTEAIAEAAVRAGCRFFAGYPITPQNEIPEYLARRLPEVGGSFVQGESEVASINMVYGAAGTGTRAMTSSSSCGISLMSEGISFCASARLPMVYVNVQRGGPAIGTIQPAQQDYTQATKASGNGGFRMRVFSPSTVQEAVDMTYAAFDYAQQDRNPVLILTDGVMGTIMEPVALPPERSAEEVKALKDQCRLWAAVGHDSYKEPRATVDAGRWDTKEQERSCMKAEALYKSWPSEAETMYLDDAEIIITHFAPVSRRMIEAAKNLKIIATLRTGMENINMEAAKERGIKVINAPGRAAVAVADFTVAAMLCEIRNIARTDEDIKTCLLYTSPSPRDA